MYIYIYIYVYANPPVNVRSNVLATIQSGGAR